MRVVVVGAGLLGVSTAWFLARHDCDVIVIDRRDGPGMETSYANGGMLTPSQADPWNTPGITARLIRHLGREDGPLVLRASALWTLAGWGIAFLRNSGERRFRENLRRNAQLAAYSLRVIQALRAETGIRYDEAGCGTMKVYRSADARQRALAAAPAFADCGVRFEELDRDGVLAREPALAGSAAAITGGFFYPDDESGDAGLFCLELARACAGCGVQFRYGTEVRSLELRDRSICGVVTRRGTIAADAVVLAAGSYSPRLARAAGLKLPIRPVKGYSLTLPMDGWPEPPVVPIVDDERHIAITPLGRRLRIAGTAEFHGYRTEVDVPRVLQMHGFVREIYPQFADRMSGAGAEAWAGLRPYTCDGVPLLGPTPLRKLFLNTGHGHLGWTMAAGSGKLVAGLVAGAATEIDAGPYRLERFSG